MKGLLKILAVVVIVIVLGLVAVFLYIDRLAKVAIEQGASSSLGVATTLDGADVDVLAAGMTLTNLRVANPAGFDTPHFLALQTGKGSLTVGSLMTDTVELPSLTLADLDINLQKKDGKANYQVIMGNMKKTEDAGPPAEGGKKFVIRSVVITNVKAHVDMAGFGGDLTKIDVPIDRIELKDVGSGGKPVDMQALSGVVLKAVFAAVIEKGGGLIPKEILGDLQGNLAQLASLKNLAKIEGVGAGVADAIGGLAGATGDLTKGVGEVGKDVGGLLGGGDDKKKDE